MAALSASANCTPSARWDVPITAKRFWPADCLLGPNIRIRLLRASCGGPELIEPDRRVDVIAQDGLAGLNVTGEQAFNRLPRTAPSSTFGLARGGPHVLNARVNACPSPTSFAACSLSTSCAVSISRSWRFFVPPAKQDHHRVPVLAEIHPVAGPEVNPVSKTPRPTPFTLDRCPKAIRWTAVVTFAAAVASRRPNHAADRVEEVLPIEILEHRHHFRRTAANAGGRRMPWAASTPAANGIATML